MLLDYLPVLLFIVLGAAFVPLNLLIGSLIRPRIDEPEKYTPYECGEESEGHLFNQFNPRFYIIALIFVVFEVELVFLFVFQDSTLAPCLLRARLPHHNPRQFPSAFSH